MEIREGTKLIDNEKNRAIIEFVFDEYTIYVFQGSLSKFDILIKYTKGKTKIRTPKHIHWVVDVLMKMQGDESLTQKYLLAIQDCWTKCSPLPSNDFQTLKKLIEENEQNISVAGFAKLNSFGEYDVEFLYVLMELLALQEKTNRNDAYMFGNIIKELLKHDRDIFKIVHTAAYGGRK